jgi:2-oxoglutarate dehydrogenase E2 component (dihydrolipoamide succinyltransferase)
MGDSISEGTLVQIVKAAGEQVNADEVVAIIDTDKVSKDLQYNL